MNNPRLLRRVILGTSHQPTGKTRHFHGTLQLPPPWELRIVQHEGDNGFYLLYCDEDGNEQTDTYHDTLEAALSQAEWEFQVKPDEWESP